MSDRPDVFVDQNAVAAVDARIHESQNLTRGLMTSWANPMEGVSTGPMGSVTKPRAVEPSIVPHGTPAPAKQNDFIVIPMQAMKTFTKLLKNYFELEVRLSQEQAKMLLDTLQAMPTPKKMFDAKAIIALMDSLSRRIGNP